MVPRENFTPRSQKKRKTEVTGTEDVPERTSSSTAVTIKYYQPVKLQKRSAINHHLQTRTTPTKQQRKSSYKETGRTRKTKAR